jgi:hypothetical protein
MNNKFPYSKFWNSSSDKNKSISDIFSKILDIFSKSFKWTSESSKFNYADADNEFSSKN